MSSKLVKRVPRGLVALSGGLATAALGLAAVAALLVPSASGGAEAREAERSADRVGSGAVRVLARTVAGVQFTLEVPSGWANGPITRRGEGFRSGGLLVSKSTRGSQGAEGVVFWTSFPRAEQAQQCRKIFRNEKRVSSAELVAVVASAPGTSLVRGPSRVRLGGRSATYIELDVLRDLGCDPGYFFSWRAPCWGACWVVTGGGGQDQSVDRRCWRRALALRGRDQLAGWRRPPPGDPADRRLDPLRARLGRCSPPHRFRRWAD